ncbi:F-box/LRR-repeat protein 4 [Lamellibrachia satsuma]|nr:F-box/LRR-repeat protein 4 [Lamellibrachia satsuma]
MRKFFPTKIEIYETFNPGTIVKILACDADPFTEVVQSGRKVRWATLWSGKPQTLQGKSRIFSPPLARNPFAANVIRLEFDQTCSGYYMELDAVCLHGVTTSPSGVSEETLAQWDITSPSLHNCCRGDNIHNNAAIITKGLAFLHVQDGLSAALDDTDNGHFDILPGEAGNNTVLVQGEAGNNTVLFRDEASNDTVLVWVEVTMVLSLSGDEVIQLIIRQLDTPTLCNLASTNRLFYKHCYDPLQYTELNLQPYWTKVTDCALERLRGRCRHLQRLNLSWCGRHKEITAPGVARFLKSCGTEMTCLHVGCCRFLDNGILEMITKSCPNLQDLNLECDKKISVGGFLHVGRLPRLSRLNLYRTSIDVYSLISIIRQCHELEHLNLGSCTCVNNFDDVALELGKNCKKLVSLDLWRAKTISDVGLRGIADNCSQLQELDLGWCSDLRSATGCFPHLAKNCRQLRKLFLTANRTVCDNDVVALATHCPLLEQLDILGTREVSHTAAHSVLENCQKLRMFDVSYCANIDFATVSQWREQFPRVSVKKSFQM